MLKTEFKEESMIFSGSQRPVLKNPKFNCNHGEKRERMIKYCENRSKYCNNGQFCEKKKNSLFSTITLPKIIKFLSLNAKIRVCLYILLNSLKFLIQTVTQPLHKEGV